jgi:hypothetical protein
VGVLGKGKTLNMSSGGMWVATDQILSPGWRVQVEVDWTVQINNDVSRKLVLMCTVVRVSSGAGAFAGLKISRHEFEVPTIDLLK